MTNALVTSLLAAVVPGAPHVDAAQPSTTIRLSSTAPYDAVFAGMKYRLIGPFRGGRADGVSGVAQQIGSVRQGLERELEAHHSSDLHCQRVWYYTAVFADPRDASPSRTGCTS
jgi:hypothetical protein